MNTRKKPVIILAFSMMIIGCLLLSACETKVIPPIEHPGKGEAPTEKVVEPEVYDENIAFLTSYFYEIEFSDEEMVNESTAEAIASLIGYSREGRFIEARSQWVGEDGYYLDLDIIDDTGETYLLRMDPYGLFSAITDSKGEYVFAAIE